MMAVSDLSIHLDRDHTWWWTAPEPLSALPTVEFEHADGATFAPAFTAIASDGTVSAVSSDRTRLTLTAPIANVVGVPGEYGEAFLLTADGGVWPVRVKSITATTVTLGERLSTLPPMAANATLRFARYYTTLTTAGMTGTLRRGWVGRVSYSVQMGADVPAELRQARYVVNVVRQPFDTGLTHEYLLGHFPDIASATPGRQQDYDPQIWAARQRLVTEIRSRIDDAASCPAESEDDIDGGRILWSHAMLTLSLVYIVRDPDRSERYEARAMESLSKELDRLWVDCDGDGLPDEGETDETVSAGAGDQGRFFRNLGATPKFTRGMAH